MKLRKLARQFAAAAVAGAMTLSLCLPALAETWDMSNKTQYPYGESAQIEVHRYTDGQSLDIYSAADKALFKTDDAPVFTGSFRMLGLYGGYDPTATATATLQDANIEYRADSFAALDVVGAAELTLSGSNTITHTNGWPAIDIDDSGYPYYKPGLLTIQGSGSLTATGPSTGVRLKGVSTLDVAGGNVSVSTTNTDGTGINAGSGTVQVSGGKLTVTGGKYGIDMVGGTVQVDSGTLDASGDVYGINGGDVLVNGGTLTARAGADGDAAVNAGSVLVNGGVLNVENNAAAYGISAAKLEVKDGTLAAKGQTVYANPEIIVSGGRVDADTLKAERNISLSGGNVKLKNVPTGTVTFSERARLTIESPVTEDEISALVEAFRNVQDELYSTAYLKYKPVGANDYVVLRGTKTDLEPGLAVDDTDIADIGTAPAGDVGGVLATAIIGGAAVWGGYEVATRVILHKMLPEGAAIPKTQAELALLLWNTAGQPEPVNEPAFADLDDTTAKAAQWCAEQGYLSGEFRPEKHVAKYNVIRAWAKAFPKAT